MAKTGIEARLLVAIKDFLPELEITIEDLKNPTQSFVCQFYTMYLEELGVNTSNITTVRTYLVYD